MSLTTTTHLNFTGDARPALEFYHSIFGGKLHITTYGDFGAPQDSPDADHVVFGQVETDSGFRVLAYDVPAQIMGGIASPGPAATTSRGHGLTHTDSPFFLALRGETAEEVGALWEKLAQDATVIEALAPTQWAPAFGMLTDRFGVTWILDVAAAYTG